MALCAVEIQHRTFQPWPVPDGSYAIVSSRQDKAVHPVLTPAQLKSAPSWERPAKSRVTPITIRPESEEQ